MSGRGAVYTASLEGLPCFDDAGYLEVCLVCCECRARSLLEATEQSNMPVGGQASRTSMSEEEFPTASRGLYMAGLFILPVPGEKSRTDPQKDACTPPPRTYAKPSTAFHTPRAGHLRRTEHPPHSLLGGRVEDDGQQARTRDDRRYSHGRTRRLVSVRRQSSSPLTSR